MESMIPIVSILAPFLSALLIKVFGRELGERSARIGMAALWLSAVASLSTLVLVIQGATIHLVLWSIPSGALEYSLVVDRLAAVMLVLISLVSLLIHVYSARYMVGDQG